jgi:hypothetical protein
LAVVEFSVNANDAKVWQDAIAIRNVVQSSFVSTGEYEVIARTEIDQLVQTQRIALSAISSRENVQKLQLLNINYIVTGTVDAIGDDYSVTLSILDVGNGRFAHSNEDLIGSNSRDIYNGVNNLVKNLIRNMTESGVYRIGGRGPAGGWIFYDKGVYSNGWRYLEAAPAGTEFRAEWGAYNKDVSGTATAVGTGKRNTQVIVEYLRRIGENGKAAQLCDELTVGDGYDDWFLPSKDELDLMYRNLKQKGLGEFSNSIYWSSSQFNHDISWTQDFSDGRQYDYGVNNKNRANSVRCVRAF